MRWDRSTNNEGDTHPRILFMTLENIVESAYWCPGEGVTIAAEKWIHNEEYKLHVRFPGLSNYACPNIHEPSLLRIKMKRRINHHPSSSCIQNKVERKKYFFCLAEQKKRLRTIIIPPRSVLSPHLMRQRENCSPRFCRFYTLSGSLILLRSRKKGAGSVKERQRSEELVKRIREVKGQNINTWTKNTPLNPEIVEKEKSGGGQGESNERLQMGSKKM